jgi:uncharacterized protein YndB with AHSA1/START domain
MVTNTPSRKTELEIKEDDVLITRWLDAPRELVFKAWTEPELLTRWYAPPGCSFHCETIDLREGGTFHTCIRNPQFHDCWCKGVYFEITPSTRLVFSMAVADENGNLVEPADAGMNPEWPRETTVTVTFDEQEGGTKLTLHQTVSESLAKMTGAYPSWLAMLDKLEVEVGSMSLQS